MDQKDPPELQLDRYLKSLKSNHGELYKLLTMKYDMEKVTNDSMESSEFARDFLIRLKTDLIEYLE